MLDVLIQTFNEEANLPTTLASVVGWVDRIFIVDSGSTDRTKEIAEQAGATFIFHAWAGYAGQKNWALDHLPFESDWILIIDADESVTPQLKEEILRVTSRSPNEIRESAFALNRMFIFMGSQIRHCGYFPSWNVRLFKRGKARYEERLVHEHMIADGPTGAMKHLLIHEDRRGLEHFLAKHNRYSSLEARECLESPEKWRGFRHFFSDRIARRRFVKTRVTPHLPFPWAWRFLYMYVFKLGFLDRRGGWYLCTLIASYEMSIQVKLAELRRLHRTFDPPIKALSEPEGAANYSEVAVVDSIDGDTLRRSPIAESTRRNGHAKEIASAPVRQGVGIPTLVRNEHDEERFASPWTLKQNIVRALWMLTTRLLFRPSFHNWYGFRNSLLRLYGARIGKNVRIRPTARIEIPWNVDIGDNSVIGDDAIIYSLGTVTIGQRVVVSQYAHLCAGTHDARYRSFPLLKPPITISDDAWVAADAFVGPGVTVGTGAILGARSSAFHDLPAYQICVGNPAKPIKARVLLDIPYLSEATQTSSIADTTDASALTSAPMADIAPPNT